MERIVFLEGSSTAATASGTLLRKQLLPLDKKFRWPGQPNKSLVFTKAVMEQIVANFAKGYIPSVPLVKVDKNNAHNNDPENVRGTVVGLEVTADGLDALIKPVNEDARTQILATQLGISAGLNMDYQTHDTGEKVGAVLRHAAWTPEPWITGMRPWEEVSLSGETFETVFLSAEDDIVADEGGDNNMAELTLEQVQQMIDDKTADLTAALADKDTAIEGLTTQIGDLTTRLNERQETATETSVDAELAAMVQAGLPPAVAKIAKPILMVGSTEVNLSADEQGTVGEQVRALLKTYPKVDFRELGEGKMEGYVVLSDEQVKELGIEVPEEGAEGGDAELSEDEKAVAEIVAFIPKDQKND